MNSLSFSSIKDLFTVPRKILLTSHTNPDGDAIGAVLAMYLFFKNLGHDVSVIVPNPFPEYLAWMAGSDEIKIYEKEKAACDLNFSPVLKSFFHSITINPNRLERC